MTHSLFPQMTVSEIARANKWSLNGGPFGSKLVSSMYEERGVPVIRGANLPMDRRFQDEGFVFVSASKAHELRAHHACRDDVIITQRGTLGQVAIIPETSRFPIYVISQSQMKLSVNQSIANPLYVYYSFRTPWIRDEFIKLGATSGVPHVNLQTLRNFAIPLPPLDTQRRIAEILGAYDDLIEVNRQRVTLLEQMARSLFEEWFIRFRFPGHEEAAFVDTADGPIPESWAWTTVGDVASYVNRGIAPRYDASVSTLVIGQKCVRNQKVGLTLARTQSKAVPAEKLVHDLDVLVNSTGVGTLGRVGQIEVAPEGLTVDSHVTIVRAASGIDKDWFGLSMLAKETTFELLGTGSTGQTELSRGSIAAQPVLLPGGDLGPRFGGLVRPMRSLAHSLQIAQLGLAASRDLLLPRLISGQLSVVEAERELAHAA